MQHVSQVQHVELGLDCLDLSQNLEEHAFLDAFLTQVVAAKHGDSLSAVHAVKVLDESWIDLSPVSDHRVIQRHQFSSSELLFTFIVEVLNYVSHLLAPGSHPRQRSHHRCKGLRRGERQHHC